MQRNLKLQSTVDFLTSYGIVIIVISVALVVVASVAFQQVATPSCISPPGFNCNFLAINKSGVVTAKISQALGMQITLNGVGCASTQNNTGDRPAYGNVWVSNSIQFYPKPLGSAGHYPPGNTIYSGSSYIFYVYCYGLSNNPATGSVGSQFTGFLWLNYTINNYVTQTQKVATFTAEYS